MKKLSIVIAALAMVLGITQCKKQENPVGGKLITQEVTFTTSFGDGSKLDVTVGTGLDAGTLSLKWEVGDKITVSDGQTEPSSTLECKSVSNNGLTGTFEGTITCTEGAQLKFTVGTEPDYMNQHFIAINESEIYLVGESKFQQSGNYEVDMALPYAILKVDLKDLAPKSGPTDVSVKIGGIEGNGVAKVTDVSTGAYKFYLLLPLTDAGQTTLTFSNGTKSITKSYSLAPNGFYTGGGNGGYAPIMSDYLCFTAKEDNATVKLVDNPLGEKMNLREVSLTPRLEYNLNGSGWNDYNIEDIIILEKEDDKVYFRREDKADSFSTGDGYMNFATNDKKIAASGNIMSLLDPKCEVTGFDPYYGVRCFYKLFYGCTSLIAAPELPATALAEYCYNGMFFGCSSLAEAPELPAETLAVHCYDEMFYGCSSLTKAPELPAKTLAGYCYSHMFDGCELLETAPELPVTTLAEGCYYYMFYGCTSLNTAPELPATALAEYCYNGMFYGCSSLSSITVHFKTWSPSTNGWVTDVPADGTFYCPKDLNEIHGNSNIPTGWTKEDL